MALKDGNDPSAFRRILAITFTNKAAAEMKERVILKLKELSAGEISDLSKELGEELKINQAALADRSKNLLSSILHQYADFSISTIDSFMHKVVKTFAYDLKLPINFNVELDTEIVLRMAIDSLLEKVGKDEAITTVLVGYTETKAEDEKNMRIEDELYAAAEDLLKEESAIQIKKLSHLNIEDFLEIRKNLMLKIVNFTKELNEIGDAAMQLIDREGLSYDSFYQGKRGVGKLCLTLQNLSPGDILSFNSYHLKAITEDYWYSKSVDSNMKQSIDSISNQLSFILNKALSVWEEKSSEYILNTEIIKSIYAVAILNEISSNIENIRNEEFIVHISEFNRRVAEIVNNEPAPFVFERLGEKYQHYLIDEFQDTSIMQWQNLLPLINDGLSRNQKSIIVGDGKQAIYRFRGGDVEQFDKIPEPYPDGLTSFQLERYHLLKHFYNPQNLSTNWRSKSEIVNFNNNFYSFLSEHFLPENLHGVYLEHEQKVSDGKNGGYINFRFCDAHAKTEEREGFCLFETKNIIRQHVDEKNYSLRDIALLTRNNKQGFLLASSLINDGIPVITNESLLVKNAPEVRLLIAWFNVLVKIQTQLNLFEIMSLLGRAKLLNFDIQDVDNRNIDLNTHSVFTILEKEGLMPDIEKIRTLSLTEICFELAKLYKFDIQKNTYLQFFLEAVWSLSKYQSSDIPGFLQSWDEQKEKLSISMPEDANAVKIMTVHKSKGLQFPIVIMPFAFSTKPQNSSQWIEDETYLPDRLNTFKLELGKKISETKLGPIVEQEENRTTLDRLNLLYVATTRAEDALYILSGRSLSTKKPGAGWEEFIENYVLEKFGSDAIIDGCSIGDSNYRKVIKKDETQKDSNSIKLNKYEYGKWQKRIEISRKSILHWDSIGEPVLIERGKIIHRLLSIVRNKSEILTGLKSLQDEGVLNEEFYSELESYANKVFNHPQIEPLIAKAKKVLSEKSLLLSDGNVIRPDRVFVLDNEIVVIDYKSGLPSKSHHKQLDGYLRAMSKIYNKPCRGMLVYLGETLKIEDVVA